MKSSTLKTIVTILFIIGLLASLFAGALFPKVTPDDPEEKLNIALIFICLFSDFMFLVASLCVVSILEHLEFSKEYQVMMIKKIETLDNKINKITTPH